MSGELKKAKIEREMKKNDDFFPGQSINTIKLDDNNNDNNISESEPKILNKLDFYPNENETKNPNNNPLSFTFKDNKNNMKETAKFDNFNNQMIDDDDENNISYNDYPSLSEL